MTTTPPPPQAFEKSEPGEIDGGTAPGIEPTRQKERKLTRVEKRAIAAKGKLSSPWASGIAIVIAILWTIPTFGLLVTSFRPPAEIRTNGWWTAWRNPVFTMENYDSVLFGRATGFSQFFVNTIVITIPAVVIPISLALLAAYAFAWIPFRGREVLFVAVFALQIVPI
jgi:alpha-glucoside transport system permease protein